MNVNVLSSLLWISDQRENYKRHNKENQNAYKVAQSRQALWGYKVVIGNAMDKF